MRKTAWITVMGVIAAIYTASSIPGLRVLPVLRQLNHLMAGLDVSFVRVSEWLAARIPLNFRELSYMDAVMQDFLIYVRENPVVIEFFLRKMAHILVFFILTIALFFLIYQYVASPAKAITLAYIGGFIIAVLDEWRQSFVPGRIASPVDVFVDMIGVTMAILLIIFSLIITSGERQRFFRHRQQAYQKPVLRTTHRAAQRSHRWSGRFRKV